jgi:hypothetical protein
VGSWVAALSLIAGALVLIPTAAVQADARSFVSVPATWARSLTLQERARADFAFSATHVVFSWRGGEKSAISYRTIDASDEASAWSRAPEAHDLEHGDRHYSGVLDVGRVAGVAWRPAGRGRVERVTVDYLNTVDGPPRLVHVPVPARAQTPRTPNIVTRAEWGADESLKKTTGSCDRDFYLLQQLFVHHTAGTNFDNDPAATMRAIYHFHAVSRGWCDVGYNFVIAPDGTIFEGRWARKYRPWEVHSSESVGGKVVSGAHVANYNSGSLGVSLMGNFSQVTAPPEARRSLAELLAWEADRHDLDPFARHTYENPESHLRDRLPVIAGHRDAGSTECPGTKLYRKLADVRRDTKVAMGKGKADSLIDLSASATRVSYKDQVSFSGTLRDESGLGLAGREVALHRRNGTKPWRQSAVVVTGLDGSFSHTITARSNVRVVAVYQGDDTMWGAQSRRAVARVAPDVTLTAEGGAPDVTGVHHYPRGTSKVLLTGTVVPRHQGHDVIVKVREAQSDGTFRTVAKKTVVVDSDAVFRYRFKVPNPDVGGSYTAVARFVGDRDHATSVSPPVSFTID